MYLANGNFLFRALVLSGFIPFNDHLELCKNMVGSMRNVLRYDSAIGIIQKYLFKSKGCLAKQGWTDEFTIKKLKSILIYLENKEVWQATL